MKMRTLIIDGGGRGGAIAWACAQHGHEVLIAPGTGDTRFGRNVPIKLSEIEKLAGFAENESVDLTIVGSEDPLALGIVDLFRIRELPIFGPTQAAAQIEASKAFAKKKMGEWKIPTANGGAFTEYDLARAYAHSLWERSAFTEQSRRVVIKASGLAAGKGTAICRTQRDILVALKERMQDRIFGSAGDTVVIEEFQPGPEVSIQAFCDGKTYKLAPDVQDHKYAHENDMGDGMTGGMGTYSPTPFVSGNGMREIGQSIVEPVVIHLGFTGLLFPGLVMTKKGLQVLEYNCRPGDPETQTLMRRLQTDPVRIFKACAEGTLDKVEIEWGSNYAVTIVLASDGYPGNCDKVFPITGIEEAEEIPGVVVFHAGTKMEDDTLVTAGGRVLNVTATAPTLHETLRTAYQAADRIKFEGKWCRRDIGQKAFGSV